MIKKPRRRLYGAFGPELPSDRPLDLRRCAASGNLQAFTEAAVQQALDYERHTAPRTRARSAAALRSFTDTIETCIADLVHRHATLGADARITVPMRTARTARVRRYTVGEAPSHLLRHVLALLTAEPLGIAEVTERGDVNAGRRTAIRAGWWLRKVIERDGLSVHDVDRRPGQELIVRKGANTPEDSGAWLDYADTPETVQMRADVRTINKSLAAADIEYHGRRRVDLTACHLSRYFNNGTFEEGGRLFGGWWQPLPGAERKLIAIDGHDTIELDFKCMGPRLAYWLLGEELQGDAYANIEGIPRDAAKLLMSAMLGSSKPLRGYPDGLTRELCGGLTVTAAFDAVKRAHPALEPLWFTGAYFRIMRHESDILMRTLLALAERDIAAPSIHESVIVAEHYADIAERTMLDAFEEHTGQSARVTRK